VDLNLALNGLERHTADIYRENSLGQILPDVFRKELDCRMGYALRPESVKSKVPTLLEFVELSLVEKSKESSANAATIKTLRKFRNNLYLYATEKRATLSFQEIGQPFFHDFKAWLYSEPRNLQINYVHKIFSVLKMLMKDAKRRGYHSNEAFETFSIKKEKTTKIALSFPELEAMFSLNLSENTRLERVRDLFLIGAYSGLRFSDFSRLSPEHIVENDGEKMIEIKTRKTGELVIIPLFPILDNLLKKYAFSVPSISSQKMNDYLKELGQSAGMNDKILVTNSSGGMRSEIQIEKWQKMSTHVARRSFATNFYSMGIDMYKVMKITGHRTEQAFREYICIDAKMAALDFAKEAALIMNRPLTKVAEFAD
jgi:integrase